MKELEGSEVLIRSREQLYRSFEEDSSMGLGILNPTFLIRDRITLFVSGMIFWTSNIPLAAPMGTILSFFSLSVDRKLL